MPPGYPGAPQGPPAVATYLDRNRGPQSAEIPGNGSDEDCDGEDGVVQPAGEVAPLERYHGRLDPALLRKYNILWIVVDAVRADHVSALGYKKKTTPYLEFLAKESLVFTQAYSQSSATMLSIPSMLAGRHVGAVTWQKGQNRLQVDASVETFAERLKREGYRTGFVVDGYLKKNLPGMLQGFDYVKSTWLDGKTRPWNDRSAAMASAYALEFLEREHNPKKQKQPFFLTVYTADPHFTYVEHPEVPSFGRGDQARYDNEIAYSDRYIGFLIEYLRAKPPLLDNTIVIITSDHGEEFDEHGGKQHATSCYEESLHVPLFVRIPGLPAARIDARVGLNDIVPTLAELLGRYVRLGGEDAHLDAVVELARDVHRDAAVACEVLAGAELDQRVLPAGVPVQGGVAGGDVVVAQAEVLVEVALAHVVEVEAEGEVVAGDDEDLSQFESAIEFGGGDGQAFEPEPEEEGAFLRVQRPWDVFAEGGGEDVADVVGRGRHDGGQHEGRDRLHDEHGQVPGAEDDGSHDTDGPDPAAVPGGQNRRSSSGFMPRSSS